MFRAATAWGVMGRRLIVVILRGHHLDGDTGRGSVGLDDATRAQHPLHLSGCAEHPADDQRRSGLVRLHAGAHADRVFAAGGSGRAVQARVREHVALLPSRAQIVTGLYEHHTGVDTNIVPLERPTIVEALHDVGYRTMLAGKYLNSWPCSPRPEFDRWACVGTPPRRRTRWSTRSSTWTASGPLPGLPDRHPGGSAREVRPVHPEDQPFFAMYSPTTPHMPSDDPRYDAMPVTPPRDPSFDDDTMPRQPALRAPGRRSPRTRSRTPTSDTRGWRTASGRWTTRWGPS